MTDLSFSEGRHLGIDLKVSQLELPGKEASNSILSFLELSRKLKQDAFDAYLEEVVGNSAEVLEDDSEAVVVLEALSELIYQLEVKRMLLRNSFLRSGRFTRPYLTVAP